MTSFMTTCRFKPNDRVWYTSSDGTDMKARVHSIVNSINGEELNLNVREDADPTRVRIRGEEAVSDAEEYEDFEDEEDDEEEDEDDENDEEEEVEEEEEKRVTGDKLLNTPVVTLINTCSNQTALHAYAQKILDAIGSENTCKQQQQVVN